MSALPKARRKAVTYQKKHPTLVRFEAVEEGIGDVMVDGPLLVHPIHQGVQMVRKNIFVNNTFGHQIKCLGHSEGNIL